MKLSTDFFPRKDHRCLQLSGQEEQFPCHQQEAEFGTWCRTAGEAAGSVLGMYLGGVLEMHKDLSVVLFL